jgi:tetratricopeptide (TPR) repeat protein
MNPNTYAIYTLGKNYFKNKTYSEAEICFKELIHQDIKFADIFQMMGVIMHDKGKFDEAISYYEKALEINPQYTEAAINLSILLNDLGKYGKSNKALVNLQESATGENSKDRLVKGKLANMHSELADIYRSMGEFQEAIDEYKKAAFLRPNFADIRTRLAMTYRDMGDLKMAFREFLDIINLKPTYVPARINLGVTYLLTNDYERAKKEFTKVIELDPNNPSAKMYFKIIKEKENLKD